MIHSPERQSISLIFVFFIWTSLIWALFRVFTFQFGCLTQWKPYDYLFISERDGTNREYQSSQKAFYGFLVVKAEKIEVSRGWFMHTDSVIFSVDEKHATHFTFTALTSFIGCFFFLFWHQKTRRKLDFLFEIKHVNKRTNEPCDFVCLTTTFDVQLDTFHLYTFTAHSPHVENA